MQTVSQRHVCLFAFLLFHTHVSPIIWKAVFPVGKTPQYMEPIFEVKHFGLGEGTSPFNTAILGEMGTIARLGSAVSERE